MLFTLVFGGYLAFVLAVDAVKVEGDVCFTQSGQDTLRAGCAGGLECRVDDGDSTSLLALLGKGVCVRASAAKRISSRMECAQAQLRFQMIIRSYPEKWMPRCGSDGYFLPKQCDLGGRCFCVNRIGIIQTDRVNTTDITCPAFIQPATLIHHTL